MELADEQATIRAGEALARVLRPGDVVTLSGDLAAGKTTFVRGVLAGLGHRGEVASPSFPIVIPYDAPPLALPVWHVDLYRIEDAEEIAELALDEVRGEGALLIEWPERAGQGAWPDALALTLARQGGGRVLTVQQGIGWEGRCPFR